MGLPEQTLQSTIATYNLHAERGVDPVLGKKPEWIKPIGTPVAAWDMRGLTAGFTLGGQRMNATTKFGIELWV